MDYLENFFKGFICIHILVTMDPRHTDAEDEQFLLNMIGEGQGDVPEQADDGSNTDIYLNRVKCIGVLKLVDLFCLGP